MTQFPVTSEPGQAVQLQGFAEAIRTHHESAQLVSQKATTMAHAAVNEALLCGHALLKAKALLKHGEWKKWFYLNVGQRPAKCGECRIKFETPPASGLCPQCQKRLTAQKDDRPGLMCYMTATKYMRLATKVNHGLLLKDGETLRQAYIECGILPAPEKVERQEHTLTVDWFGSALNSFKSKLEKVEPILIDEQSRMTFRQVCAELHQITGELCKRYGIEQN